MKTRRRRGINAARPGLNWQKKRVEKEKRNQKLNKLHFFGACGLKEVQRVRTF
jgi:hypothetical protein